VKVVQLMSGGLDSVGQAILLKKEGHEIQPLYIKFRLGGGKQSKEVVAVKKLSRILEFSKPIIVKHRIKKEEYKTRDRQLVAIAASIAKEKECNAIAIATSYYPEVENPVADIDWEDLDPKNLERAAGMKVITLEMHKAELLQKINCDDWDLLFKTTSCQMWWKKECGKCYRCVERHASFIVSLGFDRTEYLHDPKKSKHWPNMFNQELNSVRKIV